MTDAAADLPYRPNVGAAVFASDGRVLVARRADLPPGPDGDGVWQLPQGGIDAGEDLRAAVIRELGEEIGVAPDHLAIIGEHPEWLTYDLPATLVGRALGGRFRGQRQRWFALRFSGADRDIRLDAHLPAEFDRWRWVALASLPDLPVGFKRPIYERLATDFAAHAVPSR